MNSLGIQAENLAAQLLIDHGHVIIERNYRSRHGEIDIISYDNTLVFSEVKQRSSRRYGGGLAAVTVAKQRKIIATARLYLQQNPKYGVCHCRFDVIAIDTTIPESSVTWIKGAFIDC